QIQSIAYHVSLLVLIWLILSKSISRYDMTSRCRAELATDRQRKRQNLFQCLQKRDILIHAEASRLSKRSLVETWWELAISVSGWPQKTSYHLIYKFIRNATSYFLC